MEKTNKEIIFERMGLSSPKLELTQPVQEDDIDYAERSGMGRGIVENLVWNITQAIKQIDEMIAKLPHEESNPQEIPLKTDELNNIKKTLTLGLERAKGFTQQ